MLFFIYLTNITLPGAARNILFLPSIIITFSAFALYIIATDAYKEFFSGLEILLYKKNKKNINKKKLTAINRFYKSMCLFGLVYSVLITLLHLLLLKFLDNSLNNYIAFTYIIYYLYIAIFIIYPIIYKTSIHQDKSTD